tara:strand:- start:205 stop:771 length:567 start_codon:yes stop_codon:yes gene_type:complete
MNAIKTAAITAGSLFAIAHIGLLGYVIKDNSIPEFPSIQFPQGDYSSFSVEATKDGYKVEYRANDPTILESNRSLQLHKDRRGFFGPTTENRSEYRHDQFTMDGTRNLGGAVLDGEGKSAKEVECIVADAGARSQGAMAGTAISAGVVVPAVASIPYVGWLVSGWALLLGQKAGSELGSQVGEVFNDC